jgi:hypothetical protein
MAASKKPLFDVQTKKILMQIQPFLVRKLFQ